MRQCRQTSSPGPYVALSKSGAGPGTPNVVIAGSDPNGDLIASPVLSGDVGNQNITQIGNATFSFRAASFGSGNANAGDRTVSGGFANTIGGDDCLIGGQENNVQGNSNLVVGDDNEIANGRNVVSGNGNTSDNQGGSNVLAGSFNEVKNTNQSIVAGSNGVFEKVFQSVLTGLRVTGKNIEDLIAVGSDLAVGTIAGVVTKFCAVFGSFQTVNGTGHLVVGSNNQVSGTNNIVSGEHQTVSGQNSRSAGLENTVPGNIADVSGEGNTGHYGQIVRGRFSIENPVSDTVPTAGQMVEIVGWGASNASRINIRTLDDSGNEFIAGNLSFDSAKGIEGVVDGTAKNAGIVGEYLSAETAIGGVSIPSSGVAQTILQLTLTPGIWRLDGWLSFFAAAATIPVGASYAIGWSLNTNTLPTSGFGLRRQTMFVTPPVLTVQAAKFGGCCVTYGNVNINANTTFYLCARCDFSAGTLAGFGYCEARRVG